MKTTLKAGALFPKAAHTSFLEWTRTRYSGMMVRLLKKKIIEKDREPFTLEEFRADVLGVMGGNEDGAIQCRYCNRWFPLSDVAVDHAHPLSRGGSIGLDNLDYPCSQDNNRKGSMMIAEYQSLLKFLETVHPLMRKDILSRLEKANALAAGARRNQMLVSEFKKTGRWGLPKKSKDDGLDKL